MLLLQPVYGALVSRYPRRVFLPVVYGFFIATLLLFYVLFDSGVPGRGMAFFLWITVFNLFAVAVFWSFMADVFSNVEAQGVLRLHRRGRHAGGVRRPDNHPQRGRQHRHSQSDADFRRFSVPVRGVHAASAAVGCGARTRARRRYRREADGRRHPGRSEADRARAAAEVARGDGRVRGWRRHVAVQRTGRHRAQVLSPTRPPAPPSMPRSTFR